MTKAKAKTYIPSERPRAASATTTAEKPEPPAMSEHNNPLIQTAHRRLDELALDAQRNRFYGTMSIELIFEAGKVTTIRRCMAGTDK